MYALELALDMLRNEEDGKDSRVVAEEDGMEVGAAARAENVADLGLLRG